MLKQQIRHTLAQLNHSHTQYTVTVSMCIVYLFIYKKTLFFSYRLTAFVKLPNDVNIDAFISMIKLHKCLYDKNDKYFRNWDVRDEKFTKIGKACNISGKI